MTAMSDEGEAGGQEVAAAEPEVTAEILDRLEALPDGQRRQMMAVLYQHQGPLPDPAAFAAYGSIYPDAPREILAMAKAQLDHRIDHSSRSLTSEIGYRRETLWAATGVLALIVVCATALGITGHEVAAGVMGGTGGVVVAAGALLRGRDLFPKSDPPAAPEPPAAPQPPVPQPARGRSNRPPPRAPRR